MQCTEAAMHTRTAANRFTASPTQHVRGTPRIGAAMQYAGLLIDDDSARRAREPGVIVPPVHLVPQLLEHLSGRRRNAAFEIQPAGIIFMGLKGTGETVIRETRRFDRVLRIHVEHSDVKK